MLKHRPFKRLIGLSLLIMSLQASAAQLAIVIDDFGYRTKEDNQILALPTPITIAILPDSPHGQLVANKAHQQGREILIHMPMKPLSQQPLEKNTLAPSMSAEEVDRIIQRAISKVPHATGMNNHMGSEMTSSLPGMRNVMRSLSRSNFFFLDSVTIGNTQVAKAAKEFGVPTVRRHLFLDNHQSEEETRTQLNKAVAYARKHGNAIAIGHPHPSTVRALQKFLPQLPSDIELVNVSTLLNRAQQPQEQQPLKMQPEEPKQLSTDSPNGTQTTPPAPVEIGICEFELPNNTSATQLEGIHFLMFVVESIYQDKTLRPLLSNKKPSLFTQQKP
ncbi:MULTISPECIES: divergent polysaccharide deacetylase family protein [Providencia]|uniref:Divergent polysaccharide deacetylase family protein n=2 Tax=Providencia TaxID=586 RepID=A0ABD5L7V7_PROST|nr:MULTISPECIES: divergent polysaccharide deacetylase family protein [Providencia]ELR5044840.1 divergent polysaccharide deacetylase family protein [Providencia rettgeri]ELR5122712.1 divergent polysaccharide deacetylase family protein [Providencia stuartii]ELR5293011.1 divergent polysaccharide deacetylase family protein [Providencia stuartii]MCR4181928.1 divergent polysaccharide deacetylase family protein [Providencia vermicola]URE78568.1 divergent polysaccharide deacetylase family protein [Pro